MRSARREARTRRWYSSPSQPRKKPVNCVFVDEAQFLGEGQVDDLLRIAIIEDVPVLAYGIRTDFQTVAFPGSRRLLEIAHSLEELKTICRCGRKAVFNARKVGDRYIFDGDQVAIVTYGNKGQGRIELPMTAATGAGSLHSPRHSAPRPRTRSSGPALPPGASR